MKRSDGNLYCPSVVPFYVQNNRKILNQVRNAEKTFFDENFISNFHYAALNKTQLNFVPLDFKIQYF